MRGLRIYQSIEWRIRFRQAAWRFAHASCGITASFRAAAASL